jgi:hypothetical protein
MASDQARQIFSANLKLIKSSLPKTCTYLSSYKTKEGKYLVKARIKGNDHFFSVPEELRFSPADLRQLKNVILEKC